MLVVYLFFCRVLVGIFFLFVFFQNHQGIQAVDSCAECMGDFCADCLLEIQGEQYCHQCNAMLMQEDVTIVCKEASSALKFAVVGVLVIGVILEPIAISKALKAKKMIKADQQLTGLGKANAALAIAIIYLVFIITLFYLMFTNMR